MTTAPEYDSDRSNPSEHVRTIEAYAGDAAEQVPLGGYVAMMGLFTLASVALAARADHRLQKRLSTRDLVLAGIAVHQLSRTIARERVAIPLRAPFTRYKGSDGAGQVREEPRGHGLQRALGNLVTCQYCTGTWVALGVTAGLLFAPRVTRLANSMFAMVTLSDFLHQAYAGARRWSR